ncbi:ran-specific GTPase-activating protein 2 [Diutina catenulata]
MGEDSSKRQLDEGHEDDARKVRRLEDLHRSVLEHVESAYGKRITALEHQVARLQQQLNPTHEPEAKHPSTGSGTASVTEGTRKVTLSAAKKPEPDQSRPLPAKPAFGASSFGSSFAARAPTVVVPPEASPAKSAPSLAVPAASGHSESSNTSTDTRESSPAKSKPTFGSGISFGSSAFDNIKNRKNVFDSPPASSPSPQKATPQQTDRDASPATGFGANSRFGNAFQESLKKKSFLDDASPEASATESINDDSRQPKPQFKQVDLAPVEAATGEENEVSLYSTKCKLYELDFTNVQAGWRERGVGPLHLNQTKDKSSKRLVMRSIGVHKVILNVKVSDKTEFIKGYESSLTPDKFVRFNSVSSDGHPIQYMLKFKDAQVRDAVVRLSETS